MRLPASLDWPSLLVVLVATAAFCNSAMYISYAGIPFVTSDGWYFVDAFLQKYYNGGVTLQDLYMKRSVDDHAQPIHKLLLIWNADHFDLDFVVESYIGLAIAALAWLLMFIAIRQDSHARSNGHWWVLPAAASAASLVSLSGGMVFNWSLVTLGYLGPLSLTAIALATWQTIERGRWLPFLLVTPLVVFTLDTSAIICVLSVIGAVALWELKQRGQSWRASATVLVIIIASIIAYRMFSHLFLHSGLPAAAAGPALIPTLLSHGWDKLLKMMLGLAALSVADREGVLSPLFDTPEVPHRILGMIVVIAHIWFWGRALRDRWNQTQFLAVALMLFCYGAAAGIVLTRVTVFGPDYVYQQRYLMLYQLGTVALTLMAAGSSWHTWRRPQCVLVSGALVGLILLQLPLSKVTWKAAPYVQTYGNNLGRQMILLGRDPSARLQSCAPTLVICQANRSEQVSSIELLRKYKLNAFSPTMLKRYSMQRLQEDPGPAEMVTAP
jgi:hypothetical protein